MIDVLAVLFLGMMVGVLTGLLPGLHPNAVIFLLLPLYFAWQPPVIPFIAFTTGMSIVHTFVSFIPSTVLGAPDGDTALAVLPAHKYLQRGRAQEAINLTVYGGVGSAICALLLLPALFLVVPVVYGVAADYMHYLLGLFLVGVIINDTHSFRTAGVITLAGLLGIVALHSPATNTQYVLFPLFSGLFGASIILLSLQQGATLPQQGRSKDVPFRSTLKGGVYGFVAGMLAGFLPGIGSSQSALLVEEVRTMPLRDYVVTLGGINTADLFLSLMALYVIGNPRSGAAVAVQQVADQITLQLIGMVVGMAMIAVGVGAVTTRVLARYVTNWITHIPYRTLLYGVLGFLTVGSYVLAGEFGLVVLGTATALGICASTWHVRKSYCMAALIMPTILYYAGVTVPM